MVDVVRRGARRPQEREGNPPRGGFCFSPVPAPTQRIFTMSSHLGRPLPGSVAWAAERISRMMEREEQERLARRRAGQGTARTGARAVAAAYDSTPIAGGLLDPRLWTDEYYRAQRNRPPGVTTSPEIDPWPHDRSNLHQPIDRPSWTIHEADGWGGPLRQPTPRFVLYANADTAGPRAGSAAGSPRPGGVQVAGPPNTVRAGGFFGPPINFAQRPPSGQLLAGRAPAPPAFSPSTGYREEINPELGGSRHRAAELVYGGRMSPPPSFGDVYDQNTRYGRFARHIYANNPFSTGDSETWATPPVRLLNDLRVNSTDDAIGVMLTELYRKHINTNGTPPDWRTLMEQHRRAYRRFGAPIVLPWVGERFPDSWGRWLTTPDVAAVRGQR